jgi:aspartate/methionine/tyrosine aminotransferase
VGGLCATSVAIVAGETGGTVTFTSAKGMIAATGWRGGFVVLREVKWAVFVDAASEYGWEALRLAWR